jgi:hypothetical protein
MASPQRTPAWYVPAFLRQEGQDRLTFGVELEIVLPTSSSGEDSRVADLGSGNPVDVRKHFADTLNKAGILAEASISGDKNSRPNNIRAWFIKEEVDVMRPDNAYELGYGADWTAVEFNSPPFYFSREAVEEVLFVVSSLTRTYRFSITQRSDFHVHVGNADEGFDPETIQNLMATYWTPEDQIEQIHPPWMINSAIASNLDKESGIAARAAEVDPLDKQTTHLRRRGLN